MVVSRTLRCPDCGTELSREPWAAGLCPHCLVELALGGTSLEEKLLADPREAPTLEFTEEGFTEGEIHGDRYRIRSLLGRGGMGEVWRAYDLKLRVDVALKALRTELIQESRALEALRQEVRVAREVISPNVCRVYDLEELDGQELVSMEYVDGTTLQEILKKRGPLGLDEAREIASQFLAGLEAIHEAGLVHRDIKPENLMITRTGRVVVMDFGIAKGLQELGAGVVAGTPAYMSPEQARGAELDASGDLFSAGVVLAEMVEPGGMRSFEDRRRLWEGIHQKTPRVSETPWSKVIAKAVAPNPEERFAGAAALARALEEVTLRAAGDEEARPYPGLAAFQEEDARFFFGRELEVEALWKKLRRPHLIAVIGPSGAGKSSFLRAGLLPTLTDGWRAIVATPGNRPFGNLAQQLATEMDDDPEIVDRLLRFEEPAVAVELLSEWRRQEKHGLVIVDQFEELFTQNPTEIQTQFAELLGRLPLEADLHVLLSMRGDFLDHCHGHQALQPILSDLTLIGPPTGASLRRAIVEPALRCGYRFEEESIVEEMLAEVEGERGALPMVAFAAAQLWEKRDRDNGLLTREAYEEIGGVGGALAQHAEATLEQIGEDRNPIVRELFRNLVTAEGTRSARDREELLSVFGLAKTAGTEATQVLDTLIDARLLTSYDVPSADEADSSKHRIEIVHESLLTAWPRWVRWRMQDAEGAQLRDELRHQARVWHEKGRPQDLLWTGTAYREYQLWRERYPGGLSELEDAFAREMEAHAHRRGRRRRFAMAAVITLALGVAGVTSSLWKRSETARQLAETSEQQAREEARRAEASKLLALAQLRQEEDPTEALAYTTASLELADTEEARNFAMRLLWEGPPALELDPGGGGHRRLKFSPDGNHLAMAGHSEEARVFAADGGPPVVLPGHQTSPQGPNLVGWASNELLVTGMCCALARHSYLWRFPGGERVREIDLGGVAWWQVRGARLFAEVNETDAASGHELYRLRSWRLPDGEPEELGTVDITALGGTGRSVFDRFGGGWIYGKGNSLFYRPLPVRADVPDRLIGFHENEALLGGPQTEADRLWTRDRSTGELRYWDLSRDEPRLMAEIPPLEIAPDGRMVDPSGKWAVDRFWSGNLGQARVWDLDAWSAARPLKLRRSGSWYGSGSAFHPRGDWLAASTHGMSRLTIWPLLPTWPQVVDGYSAHFRLLAFSPDGQWLATSWEQRSDFLRLWPLPGNDSREVRSLALPEKVIWSDLAFDPRGRFLFAVGSRDRAYVVPLDGSPPRRLESFSDDTLLIGPAVSPSGHRVATAFGAYGGPKTLRVWNLDTDELRLFDLPESASSNKTGIAGGVFDLAFAGESTLYTAGDGGVYRWDLESGTQELVFATKPDYGARMWLDSDRRTALVKEEPLSGEYIGPLRLLDLATGQVRELPAYGEGPRAQQRPFAIDESGTVMASSNTNGIILVGRVSDEAPHLLVGHEGPVEAVAFSPDGRWIASTGVDNTIRLWPMPNLDKPPLHTLPREELLAKLKSLTNIRVVRDPESVEGWRVELEPFPGWAEAPAW